MTDVSARDLAPLALRSSLAANDLALAAPGLSGLFGRLVGFRRAPAAATTAPPPAALLKPAPADPGAMLDWPRACPGHWRGRALARRELAGTAPSDGESREHLYMADIYERLSEGRAAGQRAAALREDVERWGWRPYNAPATAARARRQGRFEI